MVRLDVIGDLRRSNAAENLAAQTAERLGAKLPRAAAAPARVVVERGHQFARPGLDLAPWASFEKNEWNVPFVST